MPNSNTEIVIFISFIIFFIVVMVTFIIIILFFIQKKQRGFNSEMLAIITNRELEINKAQLEIQEQTFQEIGREIHDNVGQILSLAKLGINTLDLERKEESKAGICEISDILETALNDLRHLSRSLNSDLIKSGGLKKSIEMQVGYLQRGGKFNIRLHVFGDPIRLHENKEIILFRVVQEAFNNIIRHAKATDINISLFYSKEQLKLVVQDNGKGFNINDQNNETRQMNGIYNMQKRAKIIEAKFEMNSSLGNGTSIIITTPC